MSFPFHGHAARGTPDRGSGQVLDALSGDPPAARALLAWGGSALAGLTSWSLPWRRPRACT